MVMGTTTTANRSTADWQRLDTAHYLHPFTDFRELGAKGARIVTRAEGVYLWDSDGNKTLDAMSGLWCVNVGYGRKELAEAAYRQMLELPFYNSFFQCAHPPAIELARVLAEVAPSGFGHVFFTGSGSESNDTIVRMVRHYWAALGQPDRRIIISRENAYHGSTVAGASLGGMKPMHAQGGLPIPDIVHIEQPYWYQNGGSLTPDEFGIKAAAALERKIVELGANRVAAFIGEPIQGAGGVIIPPRTYWPEVDRICRRHGILLISDEVICGFGRTGEWFGSTTFGFRPDLMTIAKGLSSGYLPIGGVLVSDAFAQVLIEKGGEFHHGFTYSGHPAACAVALANIEILRREKLVERARSDIGPYLAKRWVELADHPLVGEARIKGMIGALELVRDKGKREFFADRGKAGLICRDICVANGLIMRATRDSMLIAPPLIISKSEVDELIDKARRSLDMTLSEVRRRGWM
jgi:putrescine aminotransferase